MKEEILNLLENVPIWVWFTICGMIVILFELFMMFKYRRQAEKARKHPIIAPILFSGSIPEDFAKSASKLLRYEMDNIIKTFSEMHKEFGFLDAPVEVGNEFRTMMALSSSSLNLDPFEHPKDYRVIDNLMAKIKIKTKWIEAPLNALVNAIIWILLYIPAPYRKSSLRELIFVSFVSDKDKYKITVYRKYKSRRSQADVEAPPSQITNEVVKNKDDSKPFKETAFMILELHGKAFKGLKWRGMLHFTYGLDQLISYLKKPDTDLLKNAKEAFNSAIRADKDEYEACCFLGALLVSERKKESINKAIRYFEHALKTDRPKFKAFVHAGLAHCYAQQYHRLANRMPRILDKARMHANIAANIWKDEEAEPQPWIQYTQAVAMVIDEGADTDTPEEMKKQFIPAMNLCLEAIQSDEKNKLFYNLLGWMLLKLAENEVPELMIKDDISKKLIGNVEETAEHYFLESIQYHKDNKLSHANLCLLYATPYFRKSPEIYLDKCENYGVKAIEIDPDYINGYRDLTVSLIRYGEFDKAHKYYLLALEKATYIEKDQEIMKDVKKVLVEMAASEDVLERFSNPPPELLRPPTPTNST